jgi:dienelactone hydrolase
MNDQPIPSPFASRLIDGIPVMWAEPAAGAAPRRLVIWLPGFTGAKEQMQPYLQELAAAGFLGLSLDPWQHGERAAEEPSAFPQRVFSNFRRYMWPIIGQSILDTLRVIDWAISELGVRAYVRMGGVSMGGDISVAAAGADPRIRCVAAIVATPDWLRPGMENGRQPGEHIPPGEPDAYARFFYDQLNPLTHLSHYAGRPAITFECGADDRHVPLDGALRFQAALEETYRPAPDRLRVVLHPGIAHDARPPVLWQNCLDWFRRDWAEDADLADLIPEN